MMVGREVGTLYPRAARTSRACRSSKVENWTVEDPLVPGRQVLRNVSLRGARAARSSGIGGLMGAGRTALVSSLFGAARSRVTGTLSLSGGPRRASRSGRRRTRSTAGLALVSEDRKRYGLVLDASVSENLTLASLRRFVRGFLVDDKSREAQAQRGSGRAARPRPGLGAPVRQLSGGNQQKVVLGKWLLTKPRVLFLDEPTRGVDVGAKAEIYRLIAELAEAGLGVVLVSSDLPELLGMSHRVLVLSLGAATAELSAAEADAGGGDDRSHGEGMRRHSEVPPEAARRRRARQVSVPWRSLIMVGALVVIWIVFSLTTDGTFLRAAQPVAARPPDVRHRHPRRRAWCWSSWPGRSTSRWARWPGSWAALAAIVYMQLRVAARRWPSWPCSSGARCSASAQGSLVAWLKIPPFIVTLGGMLLFQGALLGITGGVTVSPSRPFLYVGQAYVPAWLGWLVAGLMAAASSPSGIRSGGARLWSRIGLAVLALGFTAVMNAYEGIPRARAPRSWPWPRLLLRRGPPHAVRPPPLRDRRQPRGRVLLRHLHRAPHHRRLHADGPPLRGRRHRAHRARGRGHRPTPGASWSSTPSPPPSSAARHSSAARARCGARCWARWSWPRSTTG